MGRSRNAAISFSSSLIVATGLIGVLAAAASAWRFGGPRESIAVAVAGTPVERHLVVVDWLLVGWFAAAATALFVALAAGARVRRAGNEGSEVDLTGELVLVVDSVGPRRRETLRTLEDRGAVGLEAVDEADAADLIDAEPPDVVLIRDSSAAAGEVIAGRLAQVREDEPPLGVVLLSPARDVPMIARLPDDAGEGEIARAVFEIAERRRDARAAIPPIIDFDLVGEAVGGSDEETLDTLRMFAGSVGESVERLADGETGEIETTRETAHRVCGAARTAGAERLARALARLERAALDRDGRDVEASRRAVGHEWTVFRDALARRTAALSGPAFPRSDEEDET